MKYSGSLTFVQVAALLACGIFALPALAQTPPAVAAIVVAGRVNQVGKYLIDPSHPPTLMGAIALAGGLVSGHNRAAYVYRVDGNGDHKQIRLPLREIMNHTQPDAPLKDGDVVFIPDVSGKRFHGFPFDRLEGPIHIPITPAQA
jgi:protein involved in polysaccharide export with SLBB domain